MATVYWMDKVIVSAFTATPTAKILWPTDALKVTLHNALPNRRTATTVADLTGEISGGSPAPTGYSAGGIALPGPPAITVVGDGNIIFTASPVTWSTTTFASPNAPVCAVISDRQVAGAANQPLIGLVDFLGPQTTNTGDFVISWSGGSQILKLFFS